MLRHAFVASFLIGCGDAPQPVMEMAARSDAGGSVALEAAVVDPCTSEPGVVGDFPAQFSGTQGRCGWLYGFRDSASGAFQLFPVYDAKANAWTQPGATYLLIWGGGMHPYPTAWSALRWSSTFQGTVRLVGSVTLTDPGQAIGGNGIVFRIRDAQAPIFEKIMSCTPNVPLAFDVTTDVNDGTGIDFMVDAKDGNTFYDTTGLNVRVLRIK